MKPARSAVALLCLSLIAVVPVAADVFVTRDGQRVETQGPWEEKSGRLVFTSSKGVLSSIRLTEVDIDESRKATEAAANPPAKAPPVVKERAKPVLVLTDESLRPRQDPMVQPSAPATGAKIQVPQDELDAAMTELTGELGKALEEMSEVLVEGVSDGMEQMGDILGGLMGALAEMAPRLQRLETEYDLDSAEGIRAAAPELEAVAGEMRQKANAAEDPSVAEMLRSMADQMKEVAGLARTDPEAALAKRKDSPQI